MTINIRQFGPNKIRIIYDFTGAIFASLVTSVAHVYFGGNVQPNFISLIAAPVFLLSFLSLFGMYGRLRFSSAQIKSIAILIALVCTTICLILVVGIKSLPDLFLWSILTMQCLVLPRFAFSISNRAKGSLRAAVNYSGPVVVTGGAGYIGTYVVAKLLEKGYSVRVLDNLMYGSESIDEFISNPRFELISGDVSDITVLTQALRGSSSVIHLAGLVGDPACAVDPEFTRHTNIVSTKLIKQVAHSLGVYRFIFASSCSVYGVSDLEVSEADNLNPVSLYAQTKIDSEIEILSDIPDDFLVTVLRFATVFGHSRRPRFDLVANLFSVQAMAESEITVIGPSQWRPFIHVEDLANAIVLSLEAKPELIQSQIFNVGDSRLNMTLLKLSQIIEVCAKKYGKSIKINIQEGNISDMRNYAVSFVKIRGVLGFYATRTMEDGVEEMMKEASVNACLDYREPVYSNLLTTRVFSEKFHDPLQRTNLYSTLEGK